jgi:hypothetical protein
LPLVAADLQGEPFPVHEESDDDLRVHPAFFGEPDLAQLVLVLGLEVEGRDVVEDQGHVAVGGGMGEALRGDLVAVLTLLDPGQAPFHRGPVHRVDPDLGQDPGSVEHRGRFDEPGGDELEERLVVDLVEPEMRPGPVQDVEQESGP